VNVAPLHFGIDVIVPRIIEIGMLRTPKEACGVVVPDLDRPANDWVVETTNWSTSPESSYEIDTSIIKQLVKDPECWSDVLVWHTHPSGMVGPSKGDMEHKAAGLRYLVVSLPRGEAVLF
jgi:proteasome lid subunit RPN8/RPN11